MEIEKESMSRGWRDWLCWMLPESLESRAEGLSKENMPGILVSGSQFLRRLLLLLVACALEVQGLTVQKDLSANPFPKTLIETITSDQERSTSPLQH